MSWVQDHLLSVLVFLPFFTALLAMAFPKGQHTGVRGFATVVLLINAGLALWLYRLYDVHLGGLQIQEELPWIEAFGINYAVGVDAVALLLLLLTSLLAPLVLLSLPSDTTDTKEHVVLLLFLQTAMLGTLVATDMFLFYFFWEAMLVPTYFLIGRFGEKQRTQAAMKFVIYTMVGSLLLLVAMLYTVWATSSQGSMTFSGPEVAERLSHISLGDAEIWLFLAFALAFAIKVALVPFHTWLPEVYVEAPTGTTVLLSCVMLKLGMFGFLRYAFWLYPVAAAKCMPILAGLAVLGVIYGSLLAMVQTDLKCLLAFSSLGHAGFMMLGMAAMTQTALTGSVLQMFNHGIATGALFLLAGIVAERRQTRQMAQLGGLAQSMPKAAVLFVFFACSSMALPGLNSFVGELLILLGTFASPHLLWAMPLAAVASLGVVLAAVYLLTAIGRVFFGTASLTHQEVSADLSLKEMLVFVPLVALVLGVGVYPQPLVQLLEPTLRTYMVQWSERAHLEPLIEQAQMPAEPFRLRAKL